MIKTKKVKKEYEEDKILGYVCDWCEKEYKDNYSEESSYYHDKENRFEIKYTKGEHWLPDGGGESETKTFELCFDCREKFIRMCMDNGINVRTEKSDW